ncbi:uncharacterized protein MONOS_3070 [Monocercomonoides exilis]|uniref:uncharacterized protein n=1 Tax=Monocercomonoides exilis TaxID=2049356 RepID=UPI003559BC67|nr:hypothetical protein MONOS_3070 [Monocercomonoides exilis]|eukprot:MONOS_3070.1-p1 / transcript=MONOS_3070.1 / gene=MONOS_3070 / organism=Monocercomonoides_exilis_PA203 / gene_product=unspecified product / transcript_product=unspecified product / location=Mono_scaffold00068:125094-126200(+) / protein_length=368 / sequence_SO=supercontig / SO=protein_coding / is_pseudo=false
MAYLSQEYQSSQSQSKDLQILMDDSKSEQEQSHAKQFISENTSIEKEENKMQHIQRCDLSSYCSDIHKWNDEPLSQNTMKLRTYFHFIPTNDTVINSSSMLISRITKLALEVSYGHVKMFRTWLKPTFCEICKKTNLPELVEEVLQKENGTQLKCLPSKDSFVTINHIEFERDMSAMITRILKVLQRTFRMRTTELIQAIILYGRICNDHCKCSSFVHLFRNSLKTLFLVCVLIAHKANADITIRNSCWGEAFGLPIATMRQFEEAALDLLNWDVRISQKEFYEMRAVVVCGGIPKEQIEKEETKSSVGIESDDKMEVEDKVSSSSVSSSSATKALLKLLAIASSSSREGEMEVQQDDAMNEDYGTVS